MRTSGIDHINLTVTDLERSRRFYADVLGFALIRVPLNYPDSFAAGSYYFLAGNVEIVLVSHASTVSGDRFDETRPGLDHLSFTAPDEAALHALAKTLDQAGVTHSGVQRYRPTENNTSPSAIPITSNWSIGSIRSLELPAQGSINRQELN